MNLSKEEVRLFYKLSFRLLSYTGNKLNMINNNLDIDHFNKLTQEDKVSIRNALYENINIIDSFIKENSYNLKENELKIISEWKHYIKDRFIIVKYLKSHTVFLSSESPPKLFGVLALSDKFEYMLRPLPVMIKTVLLPFNGKIIYDGVFSNYNISFGPGIRQSINDDYNEAKAKYNIITSLPFSKESKEPDKKELLKSYLKNERNRDHYREEIWNIIGDDRKLLITYHQEIGKSYARSFGRRVKKTGIKNSWFGILEGLIIAAGKEKTGVEKTAREIVPSDKIDFVYYFKSSS